MIGGQNYHILIFKRLEFSTWSLGLGQLLCVMVKPFGLGLGLGFKLVIG